MERTLSLLQKDNKLVTPKSDTILPSITRRSLVYVAKEYLGMEVEEREVLFERSEGVCRVWSLRNSSSHLTGWESGRSWKRDLFPKWNGGDGTCYKEII